MPPFAVRIREAGRRAFQTSCLLEGYTGHYMNANSRHQETNCYDTNWPHANE